MDDKYLLSIRITYRTRKYGSKTTTTWKYKPDGKEMGISSHFHTVRPHLKLDIKLKKEKITSFQVCSIKCATANHKKKLNIQIPLIASAFCHLLDRHLCLVT